MSGEVGTRVGDWCVPPCPMSSTAAQQHLIRILAPARTSGGTSVVTLLLCPGFLICKMGC